MLWSRLSPTNLPTGMEYNIEYSEYCTEQHSRYNIIATTSNVILHIMFVV